MLLQALCIISQPSVIPCDLEIWQMSLKNNRAPILATSSFVHHFVAIGKFKQELQSRNA